MKVEAISLMIAAMLLSLSPNATMASGRIDGHRSQNNKKHGYAISSDVARAGVEAFGPVGYKTTIL